MKRLLTLLAFACAGPATPPSPEAEPPPAPVVATAGPGPAADPAAFGDRTLVILSSRRERGHVPDALATLTAHPEAAGHPVRIDSSFYKNLMPCYDVVVADAFTTLADAKAYSARLRALGVDHYLKPAGAFVGARPELAAYCEASAAGACGDVRFVERWGAPYLRLDLPAEVAARALEGAPAPRAGPDRAAWVAELPHRTLDRWTVGQRVAAWSLEGVDAVCTVAGFVALTRGSPHFGYMQAERVPTAPGCGEPEPFAELACAGDAWFASPGAPVAWRKGEATAPPVAAEAEVRRLLEPGMKLEVHATRWEGPAPVQVVEARGFTGEGDAMCGGEDLLTEWRGVLDADGARWLVPLGEATWSTLLGVVDTDADGVPELLTTEFPDTRRVVRGADGACVDAIPYCDCPC